ncbi:hypothetical protein BDZ94DRAFT_312747 [Collybia nuda]|uniref:Uncharacterized protein n=1 Tax=Collybia nuda TaxID=64659 RepID=A0A9P5XUA4_9AGAR|nr:hypothetical protein BDZ94DRAFT_312747 [Collybia nuda]
MYMNPGLISITWDQLRHVMFDKVSMPFGAVIALLKRCANVIECTLCFDHKPLPETTSNLVLRHLQSLCLIFDGQADRFLGLLVLPSLRTLKLDSTKEWLCWSKGAIPQLIQRSGCHIEILHSSVKIHADDIASVLREIQLFLNYPFPPPLFQIQLWK